MTFKYGAGESLYTEAKQHREEQQWSPAVFYDRPRCILCYRCVRMCGEGMDVWALGVQNRGVSSVIAPNEGDHLDCEQCGMCIDVCPVGALTSGSYRYKTRPWEMNHVSTVCTHCADGCKVTLGVRQVNDGSQSSAPTIATRAASTAIFFAQKADSASISSRAPSAFQSLWSATPQGKLEPATWEQAFRVAATRLKEIRDSKSGSSIGVIGSNQTTNEENYLLQKFARTVLRPTTSTTSATRTMQPSPAPSPDTRTRPPASATSQRPRPSCSSAAIPPTSIRSSPGNCAPTFASIARASTLRTPSPSSLSVRPKPLTFLRRRL
jgi:NADH-quinone oxidoreductase subunit G